LNNLIEQQSQRVLHLAQTAEARANAIPGVGVLVQAARAYSEDRCALLAAALSYYALLSIFPLLLFILSIASPFLQSEAAIRAATSFLGSYLPSGATLVRNSLHEVTRLRGPLTIASAAGFLWSASGVFDLIQLGLNRAFRVQRPRPMWRQRIVSLGMVASVSLLFGLSFLLTTSLRLAIHYRLLPRHNILVDALPVLGALILGIAIFGLLYRLIPYHSSIRWRDVWAGAVVAAVLWEIAKLGFAWYLTNFALLNLVYGSVGAVIALMLWGYVTAAILLIGAEIAAVAAGARQREKTGQEWWAIVSP
jgi:membrane protein